MKYIEQGDILARNDRKWYTEVAFRKTYPELDYPAVGSTITRADHKGIVKSYDKFFLDGKGVWAFITYDMIGMAARRVVVERIYAFGPEPDAQALREEEISKTQARIKLAKRMLDNLTTPGSQILHPDLLQAIPNTDEQAIAYIDTIREALKKDQTKLAKLLSEQ